MTPAFTPALTPALNPSPDPSPSASPGPEPSPSPSPGPSPNSSPSRSPSPSPYSFPNPNPTQASIARERQLRRSVEALQASLLLPRLPWLYTVLRPLRRSYGSIYVMLTRQRKYVRNARQTPLGLVVLGGSCGTVSRADPRPACVTIRAYSVWYLPTDDQLTNQPTTLLQPTQRQHKRDHCRRRWRRASNASSSRAAPGCSRGVVPSFMLKGCDPNLLSHIQTHIRGLQGVRP